MTIATHDHTVSGADVPFEMLTRRARLIDALYSGEWRQGTGKLFRSPGSYCCIGVACSILGITDDRLQDDLAGDYLHFEEEYGVSYRVSRYLQSMNDGKPLSDRHISEQLSFREIARFLEIIWQMSERSATTK